MSDGEDNQPGDKGEVEAPQSLKVDYGVPDPLFDTYGELLATVEALPELPMQAAMVRRVVSSMEPAEQVWVLDQLLRGALWGRTGAAETMLAAVWWLLQMRREDEYETIKGLFERAYETRRGAVLDLFREVPAHRALAEGQRLPEVRLPLDRDVSLGERRSMAAGPRRRILERLLLDREPLVIRKLLNNPQLRIGDVRVVASRRPTRPELLQEVVYHPRWFSRVDAREAVVRNPYSDTGLSLKLLPTLGIKLLRRIAYSADLHPLIHESARRLVKLREERTAPWRV